MSSKFEYNPPTSDPHIPDVRNCGCAACRECDALRAEIERLRAVLEKWRPGIRRAVNWYSRQGDVQRAEAFAAMLADFDTTLDMGATSMTRPSPELEVKVEYDVETNTWVAWGPQTLVSGYGDSAQNAVADYRDNLVEQYNRLVELGESKVAPGLWRTVPLLSQAVEMIDAINKA